MEIRIKKNTREHSVQDEFVIVSNYIKFHSGDTFKAQAEAIGLEYEDFKNARKKRVVPPYVWIEKLLSHYKYNKDQILTSTSPEVKKAKELINEKQELERKLMRENKELEKEIQLLKKQNIKIEKEKAKIEKEKAQALRMLDNALGK